MIKTLRKKIIFVRNSFPYRGGSSTILYTLFQSMQKYLPTAEFWILLTKRVKEIGIKHYGPYWANPKGLRNVKTFLIDSNIEKKRLKDALEKTKPGVILSKSRLSTQLIKKLKPDIKLWHLTSTCSAVKNAIDRGYLSSMQDAIKRLKDNKIISSYCSEEYAAVRYADCILFHTDTMKVWYYNFYPEFTEKMEDEVFWDYTILQKHIKSCNVPANNWNSRPVDLIFVASNWSRTEKNFILMKKICQHFKNKKIIVIGFLPEKLPDGVITFSNMTHDDVIQAMQKSKVVVSPSRYDEAPNILFEGAIAGCNIVCSKNCGNYRITPEDFVADLNVPDFINKIKKAFIRKKELNEKYFLKSDICKWILNHLT